MNTIFVDLDETLIHTFIAFYGETPTKDAVQVPLDGAKYDVALREGAHTFLERLRKLGNVYILTAATRDYARAMNKHFNFGFNEADIYSREDVQYGQAVPEYFKGGKVYLFDNLPRKENRPKIDFLRPLGEVTYVQVEEFLNNRNHRWTENVIDQLVSNVVV